MEKKNPAEMYFPEHLSHNYHLHTYSCIHIITASKEIFFICFELLQYLLVSVVVVSLT